MRELLPESGNAWIWVCSQGIKTALYLMQNMIQSSLLQLCMVNFPAGFCARSLCRTTCSSRFIFCRESFSKKTSTCTKPAGSCCLAALGRPSSCLPLCEGKHWRQEAEHHAPGQHIHPSTKSHQMLLAPLEPKSELSVPEDHLGEKSVTLLRHKVLQRRYMELCVPWARSALCCQPHGSVSAGRTALHRGVLEAAVCRGLDEAQGMVLSGLH